jgi:hypothetical protein
MPTTIAEELGQRRPGDHHVEPEEARTCHWHLGDPRTGASAVAEGARSPLMRGLEWSARHSPVLVRIATSSTKLSTDLCIIVSGTIGNLSHARSGVLVQSQ